MKGTVTCGERVVLVHVNNGHVSLETGRIASTEPSHVQVDNRSKTAFGGDHQPQAPAEGSDDAYDGTLKADDIHLLNEQEARALGDPTNAKDWFGSVYQDGIVAKIHRALKRLQSKQG